MNRAEIEAFVAERTNLNPKVASDAIRALLEVVTEALQRGETVRITGFLTLSVKDRPARTGKNPKTGEPISISASKKVTVRAGKNLTAAVNA